MADSVALQQRMDAIDQQIAVLQAEREILRLALLEQQQRDLQQQSAEFKAALDTWQQTQGYLDLHQFCAQYGLHWREVETGVNYHLIESHLPPRRFLAQFSKFDAPVGSRFFEDKAPTDEQRHAMKEKTLFSKGDAVLYLGISESLFDKRRKALGLAPAERVPTSNGHRANLYRLSDVERLR